jgi:long-chain acyl-CoA synthetase
MSKAKPNSLFGVGTIEVDSNGDKAYRLAISADRLITHPSDGVETITDVIAYSARVHGTKPALGWRDIVDIHEEEKEVKKIVGGKEVTEKKIWKYFQLSDYKYINFVEVQERVSEVGRALHHYGITKDDVFNIFAATG